MTTPGHTYATTMPKRPRNTSLACLAVRHETNTESDINAMQIYPFLGMKLIWLKVDLYENDSSVLRVLVQFVLVLEVNLSCL